MWSASSYQSNLSSHLPYPCSPYWAPCNPREQASMPLYLLWQIAGWLPSSVTTVQTFLLMIINKQISLAFYSLILVYFSLWTASSIDIIYMYIFLVFLPQSCQSPDWGLHWPSISRSVKALSLSLPPSFLLPRFKGSGGEKRAIKPLRLMTLESPHNFSFDSFNLQLTSGSKNQWWRISKEI